MDKHTPTPWVADEDCIRNREWSQTDPDRALIAMTFKPDEQSAANAAFIVRAVNCHEELLATLKEIKNWVEKHDGYGLAIHKDDKTYDRIKQAIAKAEGK